MRNNTIRANSTHEWIVAVLLFLITNPYFIWHTPIPIIAVVGFYIMTFVHYKPIERKFHIAFALFLLFYFIVGLRFGIQLSLFYTIAIPLVFYIDKEFFCNSFNKFIKIFSVFIFFSLIVYFLVTVLHVSLPHYSLSPLNVFKEINSGFVYDAYPLLLVGPSYSDLVMPRFFGIYDEPGVVGTISAVVLVVNKYKLRDKYMIPIFLAGFFSFSLFFYVITIFYYIFSVRRRNVLFTLILALTLFYLLSLIPGVNHLVYNRFTFENGVWLGNSRDKEGYSVWFDQFMDSYDFWLGLGPQGSTLHNFGGASFKDIIVNYGIIMFAIYVLSLILFVIKQRKGTYYSILAIFVIAGYIFQRPFITDVFMTISFMYLLFSNVERNTIKS